ncbi:hypothetical protein J8273_3369 [Carpediemonas membranifera]|uniref:Uncharacterized protein n=1 Tax=Carpediemonas membranifera TaxID=201153 RepID=A0A8J6E1M2_9EUKA|nr:hypothetical protein J8273_3369 [Carpediemonas membranifera]|eukprot:KAG9393236.1 hypothetical protein J8273_3369 [Carpediemonas membranifera]
MLLHDDMCRSGNDAMVKTSKRLNDLAKQADFYKIAQDKAYNLQQVLSQLEQPIDQFNANTFISDLERILFKQSALSQYSDRFLRDRAEMEQRAIRNELLIRLKAMLGGAREQLSETAKKVQNIVEAYNKLETAGSAASSIGDRVGVVEEALTAIEAQCKAALQPVKDDLRRKRVLLLLEKMVRQSYMPLAEGLADGGDVSKQVAALAKDLRENMDNRAALVTVQKYSK